jgi:hypothetical protein
MEMISDVLMVAGSFGAAVYCYVLSNRLKRFMTLENGMGGAIAVLSVQVDDMTRAIEKARGAATGSAEALQGLVVRAEAAAARLELLMASLHDLPDPNAHRPEESASAERRLRFSRRRSTTDEPLEDVA